MYKKLLHWLGQLFGTTKAGVVPADADERSPSEVQRTTETVIGEAPETGSSVVPYDENLLEKARTQWQFGDWQSLAELSRDHIQHHPDRAKLILLAAAGRMQIGQSVEARQYLRLAQDWGCNKKLISQILISGVHNSIGMAAAIGDQQQRALQHFKNAIAIGTPSGDIKLLSQARTAQQFNHLSQLGLVSVNFMVETAKPTMQQSTSPIISINDSISNVTETLKQQKNDFDFQLKRHAKELTRVRDALSKTIKSEVTNATKQLEAFLGIQSYFESGEITGELHGWPISPDLGLYLINQLEAKAYDLVIEFGSGTSTQIIAKTLDTIARRHPTRTRAIQVAFEHLEHYHQKTLRVLQQTGLTGAVQLYFTPLTAYVSYDQIAYSYYDCESEIEALKEKKSTNPINQILLLVDGPPGNTNQHARYPALEIILNYFPNINIDVILDDYSREDERQIVSKWESLLSNKEKTYQVKEESLDKGMCMITVERDQDF